ncbi:MAG: hypothetical protein EKK64_05820 [Neisseriaceae bacterium]|nr:MAG: hypothetical protein EKK64_05820 [Neisseriaceae bacterium]
MPDLSSIPVPQYAPNQPYHWEYDNLPLKALADRDEVINGEVDNQTKILVDAAGTQGTLANRLNQSIDEDGNLKSSSIDESLHNIAEHEDGTKNLTLDELEYYNDTLGYTVSNPVSFVRMIEEERSKLALISDEATNLKIQVNIPSQIVLFENETIELVDSDSIAWEVSAPNMVSAVLKVSTDFAHRHYYDLEPVTSDNENYTVNSLATPFIEGSLRVYINGIRISEEYSVYYPSNPISTWSLNKFTPDHENGAFVLDAALSEDDIIRIDFDVSLT